MEGDIRGGFDESALTLNDDCSSTDDEQAGSDGNVETSILKRATLLSLTWMRILTLMVAH